MIETLVAIYEDKIVGEIHWDRKQDEMRFRYDKKWRSSRLAFPLSLSMPLRTVEHGHEQVDAFLWGLLPDNDGVLKQWSERFQVSNRHSFQLLSKVGEDCAGAIQLVQLNRVDQFLNHQNDEIDWLTQSEVEDRIHTLLRDHSATRFAQDHGQFSLAGAQPKIALHRDSKKKRWGIPAGSIPTTHILKPAADDFEGKAEVEHFCLRLARKLEFRVPATQVIVIGETPVFVAKRYDRTRDGMRRIHQEDFCQALSHPPQNKYQSQGGPGPLEIVTLLRKHSSKPQEDVWRFFDALAFNWLIAGTDAHAKNYSLIIAPRGRVEMAPLYDLISTLPYAKTVDPRRAKLAMKIGGKYLLRGKGGVSARSWEKCALELELDPEIARDRILSMIEKLPKVAGELADELVQNGLTHEVIGRLVSGIGKWTKECAKTMNQA
tara:strand:+ start:538 stop:1836 length:1299 start_codon:yes stop_codon:yes gene_type:complete